MAVTSVDEFFKLLEKSSLLSAEQFQAARQQLRGEKDPKTVARKLLAAGQLTKWQALQLLNGRSALTIGPYRLRDALAGDNVARVFRAQHSESGQLVELRSLSRGHAAERPEALDEFVADVEKTAGASGRKVLEVHRPDGKDETCYVVLEEAGGGATTAAVPSDSSAGAEAAAAAAAGQASADKPADASDEKPAVQENAASSQESAAASAVSESRPPRLKPKVKPAESAPAQSEGDSAEAKDKAVPATPAEPKVEIKIAGQDAVVAVPATPAEFKIARGKRRKKPAAAAAGAAAKPEAAEGDATATGASSSKRALSPALLIGGAVGGGLLLVAAVVVAWLLFFRNGSPEIADAGGGAPPASQVPETPKEDAAKPAEPAEPAVPEPADPVVSDPVVEVQPAAPAVAEPKSEAAAEPAAAKSQPATPETPQAKPAEPPTGTAAESGKEPAESKPATEPAKMDVPETEPAAKEPAAKEPAAKEAAGEQPAAKQAPAKEPAEKEAEKEAEKKPPAPPPGKKPFADLKPLAKLPDVSDTNPVVLGRVYVPANELCFLKLRGGEKARKGVQHLVMKNANEGLADKDWEISVRDVGGAETIVALLKLNDQSQLVFQWGPNAKAQDLSPYLCNCALALTCAGESKAITFRDSTPVEPLTVDLSKPLSKKDWPIKFCPDPEAVRFQITGVQGAKSTVDPAEPTPAKKETAWVKIEDGGGMLSLKIDANLTNDFQLTASPHIKLSAEAPKPDKFIRRMFENNIKAVQAQSEAIKQRVQAMQQYAKGPAKDAKQVEQNLPAFELDARNAETLVQNMKRIDDLLKRLDEGMKIQFRVFYDADSTEVVLLKSK